MDELVDGSRDEQFSLFIVTFTSNSSGVSPLDVLAPIFALLEGPCSSSSGFSFTFLISSFFACSFSFFTNSQSFISTSLSLSALPVLSHFPVFLTPSLSSSPALSSFSPTSTSLDEREARDLQRDEYGCNNGWSSASGEASRPSRSAFKSRRLRKRSLREPGRGQDLGAVDFVAERFLLAARAATHSAAPASDSEARRFTRSRFSEAV